MDAKAFVQQLSKNNEALFRASELQVKSYFDSKPSKEELTFRQQSKNIARN
jgi:hypothetical protein